MYFSLLCLLYKFWIGFSRFHQEKILFCLPTLFGHFGYQFGLVLFSYLLLWSLFLYLLKKIIKYLSRTHRAVYYRNGRDKIQFRQKIITYPGHRKVTHLNCLDQRNFFAAFSDNVGAFNIVLLSVKFLKHLPKLLFIRLCL